MSGSERGDRTAEELLAELERTAHELREVAHAGGDHGLAVIAGAIADYAGVGAWARGAIMEEDGFRAAGGEPGADR